LFEHFAQNAGLLKTVSIQQLVFFASDQLGLIMLISLRHTNGPITWRITTSRGLKEWKPFRVAVYTFHLTREDIGLLLSNQLWTSVGLFARG